MGVKVPSMCKFLGQAKDRSKVWKLYPSTEDRKLADVDLSEIKFSSVSANHQTAKLTTFSVIW